VLHSCDRVKCDSPALHRHLGVLSSNQPPSAVESARGVRTRHEKRLAEAFRPFSIFRKRSPLCAPHRSMRRPEDVARSSGGAARRVWLPSRRIEAFAPSRASFSSQRSWALPFRAFLLPGDRRKVSLPHPLLRFAARPVRASCRRFSGLIPPGKPRPSSPPEVLRRVGAVCSPGVSHLPGSPAGNPRRKASPFPDLPSRSYLPAALRRSGG